MTNIKEEKNTSPTPSLSAEKEPSKALDTLLEKGQTQPRMSRGEKWYNRLVYQGLNYWVNLGLSLYVTDLFAHGGKLDPSRLVGRGGWFKSKYEGGVSWFTDKLGGVMGSRLRARRFGEIVIGTFTLNSGGNILLIPTKYLEDYKRPIVHALNKYIFRDKQLAPDGHEMTADEIYIEQEQPKQSWARMIGRRALGFGATTTVGLTLDWALKKKLDTPYQEEGELVTHQNGQKWLTDKVVNGANRVLNGTAGVVRPGTTININDTTQRYMRYAALDWVYTIITSKILHATNGAHEKKMPGEIGENGVNHTHPLPSNSMPEESDVLLQTFADNKVKPRARDITPASSHAEAVTKQADHTLFLAP